jgi:hypothetical protein
MIVDYEYEEKLLLQLNSAEIDLLESAIPKLQENQRKIGFRKSVINSEEIEIFNSILKVINEMRQE